jgi:hypothetical protein
MPDLDLINQLVQTYRTLNLSVRTRPEERLRARASDNSSVWDVVRRMRDDELRFSQALKERITGVPMPEIFGGDDAPVIGTESDQDSTAAIIAQFGTARESTLAMLRSLPDPEWDAVEGDQTKSIRVRISELIDSDKRQLDRIGTLIGAT